jgi:hypothetical protein
MTNLAHGQQGRGEGIPVAHESEKVTISSLSDMTGFPEDFIKRELLLEDDRNISMHELRQSALRYLEDTALELKV